MDIQIETHENCSGTLKAAIPAAHVEASLLQITSYFQKQTNLPGFRKGKVPATVIQKRFNKEITAELHNNLFEEVCSKALQDNPNLKVLNFGDPSISNAEDGGLSIESKLLMVPDFDLPDYVNIEVSVPSLEISDADVEAELVNFAERMASYEIVDKAATSEDVAVIDFSSNIEGKPLAEALGTSVGYLEGREGQWFQVKDDAYLPGLGPALEGTKAGDEKTVTITMPDTYPTEELRGKNVTFDIKIKEIREKATPAIDEALAEKVMPGKSLADVKIMLKDHLAKQRQHDIETQKADQISDKLAALLSFELPEEVVQQEAQAVIRRKLEQALYSGKAGGNFEELVESMKDGAKEEAISNLRVYFALQEIAQKENITVTDHELAAELHQQAARAKQTPKAYINKMRRENRIPGIRTSMLTAKTLDFLVKAAKVTEQ